MIPLGRIAGCRAVHGKINTYVRESLIYSNNYVLILWVHLYPILFYFLSCIGFINGQELTGYKTGKLSGPRLIMGHSTCRLVNGSHESLVITGGNYTVINTTYTLY